MSSRNSIVPNGLSTAPFAAAGDLYRTLVENATETIFLIDLLTEECLYVSPGVDALLGLEPAAMIGCPLTDFVHPDDAGDVIARSTRRRHGNGPSTSVTRMSHSDGQWVWVEATASAVLNHQGRTATVFTVTNAGERVLAETALRAARLRLRRLVDQISAGQERLSKGTGDSYAITVEALAAALELRDDETGHHTRRVSSLALELTRLIEPALACDPELRFGFLLHDIGKIGIPDSILLKTGQLSAREVRVLQMHTTFGEHLLSLIPFVSDLAHDVVAYHHERWDGSGYPCGLRGERIPIAARIFAVADAFDATTSDRPYRGAKSISDAINEIESCSGTQFDPAVVDAFLPVARQLATSAYAAG